MKRFYSLIVLFALVCCGTTAKAAASYYVVDGIRYYASNATTTNVTVTALSSGKYSGDIVIPASFTSGTKTYTVTGIKGNAFDGCTALTSVTIEEGPTTLEMYAFYNCSALKTVSLPATLNSATYYAFYSCSALESVTFAGSTPPSTFYASGSWPTFYNCSVLSAIYVPADAVETYKTAWAGSTLVDLVQASSTSSCAKPGTPVESEVSAHHAKLTWDAATDVSNYQFSCVLKGIDPDWKAAQNVLTVSIDTLKADTEYDFYVRSYCGSGDGEQSAAKKVSFKTDVACHAPASIAVSEITSNGATLTWTASGKGETQWQYAVAEGSAAPNDWSEATTELSVELTSLKPATTYKAYVRSFCGEEGKSDYIASDAFTTACAAVNAPITWDFKGETSNTVPGCWDNSGSTSTNSASNYYYVWGVYNEMLRMCNYYVQPSTGSIALINTPSVVMPASPEMELTFDYTHNSNAGDFTVKISKDAGANWTELATYSKGSGSSYTDPGTLTPVSISLADYAGETIILQFYAPANYDKGAIFVDNISIKERPACAKPTGLGYSEKAAHSVKLAWTSDASAWKVEYSEKSDFSESTIKDVTENPYVLSELDANTHYYVRVKADCGESGVSEPTDAVEFTTECDAKTLPFPENFESGSFDGCWKVDSYWAINSNAHAESSYCARFTPTAAADLVLPSITINDDAMLYYWHANGYVTGSVLVNGTEKQTIATTTNSNWKKDSVDLSTYKGQTITITFRGNYSYYSSYLYIDDILVDYKSVAKPTELTATPGNATATLTWESTEGTSWNLRYRVVGADEWITENGLTEKSKVLEGLTNGSTYEAQVQAVCSANRKSDWTASANFTPVACPSVTSISLGAQTYNSIVVNWETSGAGTWDLQYMKTSDLGWTKIEKIAETTKTLNSDLVVGEEYTVQVSPSCNPTAYVETTFTLVYSTPANAAVASITDATATASWDAVSDAPNGYKYIVVAKDAEPEWASATATNELSAALAGLEVSTDYDFYVAAVYGANLGDAAKVSFKTVTVAPKNFTQVALGATTATYSWEKDGANTTFEYSLDGEAWTDVATNQVELKGLTGNTAYTLYVRSVYDGELRSANASVSFRTECAAVSALTWTDGNFENETAGNAPRCWTIYSPNAYPYVNTWYPHAGSKQHLWFQDGGKADAEQIAALPEFTEDIKTLKMSFYYHNNGYTSSSYPSLEVGVMSDVNDSASFRTLFVLDKTSSYATNPTEVLFNGATASEKYIAFRLAGGTYNGRATIDDITFSAAPTCFAPVLAEPTILPDGATFTWTAGNGEEHFQYAIDTTETLVWTATDETTVTVHGFAPGTQRKFYVRAFCNPEVSESVWTAFTPECPAPAKVDTVDGTLTTNAVSIHWTAAAGITNYQYSVVAKNASADWTKAVLVENATTAELSGLSASTEYTVYVRSYYSAISQSSAVSVNFATECALLPNSMKTSAKRQPALCRFAGMLKEHLLMLLLHRAVTLHSMVMVCILLVARIMFMFSCRNSQLH